MTIIHSKWDRFRLKTHWIKKHFHMIKWWKSYFKRSSYYFLPLSGFSAIYCHKSTSFSKFTSCIASLRLRDWTNLTKQLQHLRCQDKKVLHFYWFYSQENAVIKGCLFLFKQFSLFFEMQSFSVLLWWTFKKTLISSSGTKRNVVATTNS